ncbi:MAG TPA: hypothetical protein VGM67_06505 [Gemmatimonadaceae bacterium]|jgi:hypothetical protein
MVLASMLIAALAATAGAQSDSSVKPVSRDSAAASAPAATIAQVEAAGIKLLGISDAATGNWIDHATIRDTLGNETVTSAIGVAALSELTPVMGYYMFEVRKPGYTPQRFKLKADTSEEFLVSLTPNPLGRATALPAVITTAARMRLELDVGAREGFFARCATGLVGCMGRAQLDPRPTERIGELLEHVLGMTLRYVPKVGYVTQMRMAFPTRTQTYCDPTYYLNGFRWSPLGGQAEYGLPASLSAKTIDGIEVYLSGMPLPTRWADPGTNCGVVAIWTH